MKTLERTSASLRIEIDASLYSADVLFKCFYWYGGRFAVEIERSEAGDAFVVSLRPLRSTLSDQELDELDSRIRRDLVDFKTRDIVSKETRLVRELLIAKAFAHSDEFDTAPPGEIADPLNFDPSYYVAKS